jgi:hypothetical protein
MNKTEPLYSFKDHPADEAKLKEWNDVHGIALAMRTTPLTESEKYKVKRAIFGLYRAANLKRPRRVVFCDGPISAAIAAGVAAGVWYLREHPAEHRVLLGRSHDECDLMAAVAPACAIACKAAVYHLETGEQFPPQLGNVPPVDRATASATESATYSATRSATDSATESATLSATRSARVKGHTDVVHERDYDTHETVRLDSGDGGEVIFEIRRQEELRPDGWARVED